MREGEGEGDGWGTDEGEGEGDGKGGSGAAAAGGAAAAALGEGRERRALEEALAREAKWALPRARRRASTKKAKAEVGKVGMVGIGRACCGGAILGERSLAIRCKPKHSH